MVFISGQIPLHPTTGQLVGGDIKAQTEQVLSNLRAVLTGVGLSFSDVVKTTIFLTDLANFQAVNELYSAALGDHKPARSTFQVSALPREAAVEIEMIALDKNA
jgi:2-iminobutanoate/2-iminopropanoate deaminase